MCGSLYWKIGHENRHSTPLKGQICMPGMFIVQRWPTGYKTLKGFRDGLTKKNAALLDFVQMGRGVPCPNFLAPFRKCNFGQ